MELRCLGSSSSGNCYLLESATETLILDCGLPIMEIKKGLKWNLRRVSGVLVSHSHKDHSKSLKDFETMGIPVFKPYQGDANKKLTTSGGFTVVPFDLTTLDGSWTHTNADGTSCPCYGFLITHPEMGKMLYITDTEFVKYKFKKINHILLGVNYDKDMIDRDNVAKARHVFRGHMSIDTACDFVKANYSDELQNVIMCHLSNSNADSEEFIEKMQKVACRANVDVAESNKVWILNRKGECPF